ncbi:MAG TPA: hypothetical protein VJH22_04785, partial [Candidatus Nanoarchaeia archaeon]|nr:hypothetical protein [Candidatus Nanoarchaeia archaeon]
YASGSQTAAQLREDYKQQLLSPENDGTYTYGNRTRRHFGMDQLQRAIGTLRADNTKTVVISRFDPVSDMTLHDVPVLDDQGKTIRTRLEATHDPCLTHDIYFVSDGKLQSLHIARAHNIINAYPENIFGLHDAYDSTIAKELGLSLGDMFMLSARANILLLTEEQKAKKIIAEPSKPIEALDQSMGPHDLSRSTSTKGIAIYQTALSREDKRPNHPCLKIIESYRGVNLLNKSTDYLRRRGTDHNNPLITCIDPRESCIISGQRRLAFFQCNERAGKIHATAVFCEGSSSTLSSDLALCKYLASRYADQLCLQLGTLCMIYAPLRA